QSHSVSMVAHSETNNVDNSSEQVCALREYNDLSDIQRIVDKYTENGKQSGRPNNATAINAVILLRDTGFTSSKLRAFTSEKSEYLILVEENVVQLPWITIRTPNGGHDFPLLKMVMNEIIHKRVPSIHREGQFLIDCDQEATDEMMSMLNYPTMVPEGEFAYFYMTDDQCDAVMKETYVAPAGYVMDSIREHDFDFVMSTWKYCDSHMLVKERLRHFPCIAIRTENGGELASFMSTHTMGLLSHLYTLPAHRGKGLGKVTEMRLAQMYIERGLRPYKAVSFCNKIAYESSLRSPFYTLWKRKNGEPICWNFGEFTYKPCDSAGGSQ
ncbi:hypothetical protein PFISCL1PPCAC_12599, partial [Pristionchus fissidentatus]